MGGYYVCIDSVAADKLSFLGYALVSQNEKFEIWQDLTGDEHILAKDRPRYLYLEDLNDAIILGVVKVIPAPKGDDC